jgi:hypothetical protein
MQMTNNIQYRVLVGFPLMSSAFSLTRIMLQKERRAPALLGWRASGHRRGKHPGRHPRPATQPPTPWTFSPRNRRDYTTPLQEANFLNAEYRIDRR